MIGLRWWFPGCGGVCIPPRSCLFCPRAAADPGWFMLIVNCVTLSVSLTRLPCIRSTDCCCRSSFLLMLRTSLGRRDPISSSAVACACAASKIAASSASHSIRSWERVLMMDMIFGGKVEASDRNPHRSMKR
jgi:hypothetical protein